MPVQYRLFGVFRLALALMVVMQHALRALGPPQLRDVLAPVEIGSVAVTLFFVLSGFIIVEAAAAFYEGRAGPFLTNRVIRIYPPYIVALILTVLTTASIDRFGGGSAILDLFGAWPDHSVRNILAGLFGILPVAGKFLEPPDSEAILVLAWALRVEMVFYVIVFLALAAGNVVKQPAARLFGLSGISLLVYDAFHFNSVRGGGLEYTPYFVLGASVYFAITPASFRRRAIAVALIVITCAMIALHIAGQDPVNEKAGYARELPAQSAVFFAGIAIWFGLIAVPNLAPAFVARWRALDQASGELTYPLYLTHMCALMPLVWLVPHESILAWPLALSACLGVSFLMYRLVDRPLSVLRQRIRRQNNREAVFSA